MGTDGPIAPIAEPLTMARIGRWRSTHLPTGQEQSDYQSAYRHVTPVRRAQTRTRSRQSWRETVVSPDTGRDCTWSLEELEELEELSLQAQG